MHPDVQGNRNQSLAEATIPPGTRTFPHRHNRAEEIYLFIQGSGIMHLEKGSFPVTVGDTICILPGQAHFVENNSDGPLVFLCCCSPPYSHDDTEVLQ
jgi:mannose-6-phosphate isomerase-like protein (cupin superfamily)